MLKKIMIFITRWILKGGILIAILVLVFFVGQYAYRYTYGIAAQPSPEERSAREVEVTIPEGATTKKIGEILYNHGLVGSVDWFRIKSRLGGNDGTYKHGSFVLNTGMDEDAIMKALQAAGSMAEGIRFTIPEGYTLENIAKKLEAENIVKAEEFLTAANEGDFDYNFIKYIPKRNKRLEGYLFPDTYEIRKGATPQEIISKMLKRFDDIYRPEYYLVAEEMGYSLDEIITIASIIESEARVAEERPKIAGVIYNRIDDQMKLQMCSTVLYALGKRKERLLYADLEVDSPYNTYLYEGLPEGPIANPGEASIKAALYPEEHDYFFFVLKNEETGEHVFTKTNAEHEREKARYNQKF